MALQDLLNAISDETERSTFSSLLDKYAPVKTVLERGDAVAGAFEKIAGMNLDPVKELNLVPDWVDWRTKNTGADGKIKAVSALESEREALKTRVAELEAKGETDLTADEVKAIADAQFEARLKLVREDQNNPLVDRNTLLNSMNAQSKRFQEVFATLTPFTVTHAEKFKESIPLTEVMDYMEKRGERDPVKAYQAVCEPRETKLKIAALEAEAAKKFEEGKAAGVKDAQDRINAQRMPVDGGGSQRPGANHFMSRVFDKRQKAAAASNGRLGSGAPAAEGFAQYQKKMAGATGI